jgi:tetratricopeptide (TPR) repeat protein
MTFDVDLVAIKACLLVSLYPFCLLIQDKKIQVAITICFLLTALFLKSRTLFCIVFLLFLYSESVITKKLNKGFTILLGMLAIFLAAYINIDSLIGRVFIWANIFSNVDTVPLLGFGRDTFKLQYAKWQAGYFAQNESWSRNHLVADAPSFAFNEFLHFYIEYGILVIIIFSLLIYFNIRIIMRKVISILQALALSNLCVFAFALVSYPLHSVWVLFILLSNHILMIAIWYKRTVYGFVLITILLAFILVNFHRYFQAKEIWLYAQSFPVNANPEKEHLFNSAYITLHNNQYFLYDYCSFLLNEQNSDKVLSIGNANRIYFNQYEYSLLMGTAYLQKNKMDKAKVQFKYAHNIIPNRFIPLYQLLSIAKVSKDTFQIIDYGKKIISMPIKVPSLMVDKIKEDAKFSLRKYN